MKKHLLKPMMLAVFMILGTVSTWALTADLSMNYELAGYKAKAFYDLTSNDASLMPTEGDLRYRADYGLFNFGSGSRSADINIPVTETDLLVCQFADTQNRGVTINTISACTKSTTLNDGSHLFFEVNTSVENLNINIGRGGCVVSILVMEKDNEATIADYTLNYMYEGSPVKTVTASGAVGATVLTDASFFADDVKYFRADGQPESFTVAASDNTFNVNVRLAATYNYTLENSLGGTITSGSYFEGETVYAPYPRYQLKDGAFYEAAATNKEYRKSIALTADNASATVEYAAKDGANAVFFAEAESLEGVTNSTFGNIPVRASNALAATAEGDVKVTTLAPGKYKFHIGVFTSKGAYADFFLKFAIGADSLTATLANVNLNEFASEEFTLTKMTAVTFSGANSSADAQFDYIWIEKTGDMPFDPATAIVNAGFNPEADPLGWDKVTSAQFNDLGMGLIGTYQVRGEHPAATVDETHLATEFAAGLECRWSTNYAAFTQTTAELPAGSYKLTFDVENTNATTTKANYENRFNVTVGETTYADESTEWMDGKSAWTTHTIAFTLTEASPITISLGYGTGSNNFGVGNTPALFVSHLTLEAINSIEIALIDLQAAIEAAQAKAATYTVGTEFFTYAESEIKPLNDAIATAQAAYTAAESAEAVKSATETLNAFVATFAPVMNKPAADKAYTFELRLGGETPLYMALAEGGITIAEEATPLKFVAVEGAEGQYNLSNEDGTLFVGLAGGNAWTMSTLADQKAAWTFTALPDGAYHINNLVTAGRFVGTNTADKAAGSVCYADKQTSNGNVDWLIAEYVAPVANDEVDQKFTSVEALEGQLFAIVNEADGKAIYNVNNQNLAYDTYANAMAGTAYLWKIHSLSGSGDENLTNAYAIEAVKADGSSIELWGNSAIYLNSGAEGGFDGCFILGLNNQNGQDVENGAAWEIEYDADKGFALKNVARGGYFAGVNPAPTATEPIYWTFCTLKEKAQTDPLADQKDALSAAIAKAKMINALAYTEATFTAMTTATTNGETALAAADATAESLTTATTAINDAITALALKDGFTSLKDVDFGVFDGWGATAKLTQKLDPTWDLFKATGQSYGDPSVNNRADVSAYDKLYVVAVSGSPRILLNRDADGGQWNENEAESHLIDNTKGGWSAKYFSTENGITTVDLKQLVADKGFAHLTAIKSFDNNVISGLYLYKAASVVPAEPTVINWVAADQNYDNGQEIGTVDFDENIKVVFDKNTNNNAPKYYTTGTAVRAYGGNTITISGEKVAISKVEFTFASGEGTNDILADKGTYAEGVWTAAENTNIVKFTIGGTSGHRRIATIKVTYTIDENAEPVVEVHIANTAETAYTIAKAIELIEAGDALGETVFVKGIVSQVDKIQDGAITYWISDDGTTANQFECYKGKNIDAADFAAIEDVEVGAEVIVKGTMKKYTPAEGDPIYEFNQGNELVTYKAPFHAPFADGKYYVYNVGTQKYLAAGADWGTHAVINATGLDYGFALADGKYTMDSQISNGGNSHFLNGEWNDGAAMGWTIAAVEGKEGVYTISNGEKFLTAGENNLVTLADDATAEAAQWSLKTLEARIAELATATAEAPVNATFLIQDANFGRNDLRKSAWKMEASNQNLSGGDNINNCAESYHAVFTLSQMLTNVPKGVYTLTAQGFYRQDGSDNENLPVFFANDYTQTFPLKTGSENSMSDASASFSAGNYTIDPIYFQLTEAGDLTVGAKLENNAELWCILDNFQLTYYGVDADLEAVKNAVIIKELADLRTKAEALKAEVEVDAVKTAIDEALGATAEASGADAINTAIATMKAVIEKADVHIAAKAALDGMANVMAGTNVYTAEAFETYKGIYDAAKIKYEAGELTKDDVIENPEAQMGWHAANTVDDLLLSVWTIGETQCKDYDAGMYINTWSVEGNNDGSNFKVPFFEYWTGDANSLGENVLTATMTNLPEGEYDVTAWVRVRAKNDYTAPAYGITLSVNEGEAVDVAAGDQIGESQFYLKEFTATGTVAADGVLKIKFNVAADNNISWLSFKNVKFEKKNVIEPIEGISYSWESPEGEPIQWGGTIEYVNGDGNRLNYIQGGYYTICLNGKKVNLNDETPSANAGKMVITLDNAVAAGDTIAYTAFLNKDASKTASPYFLFETGADAEGEVFGDEANINTAFNGVPTLKYTIVPEAADGSKTITMTRNVAGTNLFITKLQIIEKKVETGITMLKTAIEDGNVYNLNGQKVNKAQKGLFIINGKKVVIK